jgi:hypothetical protein
VSFADNADGVCPLADVRTGFPAGQALSAGAHRRGKAARCGFFVLIILLSWFADWKSIAPRPFCPVADFAAIWMFLPAAEFGCVRGLVGQMDLIRAFGSAVDREVDLAVRRAEGEVDFADDHRALAVVLRQVKGMVVLCGYAGDLYDRELYPDWDRVTLNAMADGGQARIEVLWINPAAMRAGRPLLGHF